MIKTIFTVIPFVFAALVFAAFVVPAKVRVRVQAIMAMFLLFCSSKFLCFSAFGGDAFAPELPERMIWFWGWAYSGMCFLAAFSVVLGPVRRFLERRSVAPRTVRWLWLAGLPALSWTLSAVGVWNGVKPPEVHTVEVEFENLPESLDGYRVLQISDIHASASARRWRTKAIVDAANAAGADMICLTGDNADGLSQVRKYDIEPIRNLKARDGVYAVTGNHEYYFDTIGWMAFYDSIGIKFLVNECVFPRPGLAVAGVNDLVCERAWEPLPDPDAALASATNGEFRILLQHRPYMKYEHIVGREMKEHVDFQLSGHSHGGICPVADRLIAMFNGGYVRGLYRNAGNAEVLCVSPGAGQWAGFPVRFFNDPEITLYILRRKAK